MKRLLKTAALSGIIALALASGPALAQDVTMWRPATAAGGAPVDPSFWNNQATVRLNGIGGSVNNFTIAPTNSVYNDYSSRTRNSQDTTNYDGGLTNNVTTTVAGDQVTTNNGGQVSTTNVSGPQTNVSAQGNFHGDDSSMTITTTAVPPGD